MLYQTLTESYLLLRIKHNAGTGNFSAAFHRLCGLIHQILCVDPYDSLLVQARAHPEGGFVCVITIDTVFDVEAINQCTYQPPFPCSGDAPGGRARVRTTAR